MYKYLYAFLFVIGVSIVSCLPVNGQTNSLKNERSYKNSVAISFSFLHFPAFKYSMSEDINLGVRFFDQIGIGYTRKINDRMYLHGSYEFWNDVPFLNSIDKVGPVYVGEVNYFRIGGLQYRQQYKMFDVFLGWRILNFTRSNIEVNAGMSYAYGNNTYIDTIYNNGYHIISTYHNQIDRYLGCIGGFKYDYFLFNDRFVIGAHMKMRKYFVLPGSQLEYGIHFAAIF